jgi:hypothetical protein
MICAAYNFLSTIEVGDGGVGPEAGIEEFTWNLMKISREFTWNLRKCIHF